MIVTRTEVVVIGIGTMGSAILWRLAERGVRAIGIEQFAPGHDRGSGHGESRILRTAHHEHPAYVPLIRAAIDGWRDLERQAGSRLLTMTGGLTIGPPEGVLVSGALEAAKVHDLAHQVVTRQEMTSRFPAHRLLDHEVAVWEEDAGVVQPEQAIIAAARQARDLGATLRTATRVRAVEDGPGHTVLVRLDDEVVQADHVVVAAGAWIPRLVPDAPLPLEIERKVLAWFPADEPWRFRAERFPVFIRESPEGRWYGFPTMDDLSVKVAFHHGGALVDPDEIDRVARESDTASISEVVRSYLPGLRANPVRSAICMYANTPDAHFAIGTPATYSNVSVVSACSGHGFKFAPVIGEVAADLSLGAKPPFELDLFDIDRFADSFVADDARRH